jgi:hypothetical protein
VPVAQDQLLAATPATETSPAVVPAALPVTLQISRSTTANEIQPALQAANNRDALLGLAAVQFQMGNHILKYL